MTWKLEITAVKHNRGDIKHISINGKKLTLDQFAKQYGARNGLNEEIHIRKSDDILSFIEVDNWGKPINITTTGKKQITDRSYGF